MNKKLLCVFTLTVLLSLLCGIAAVSAKWDYSWDCGYPPCYGPYPTYYGYGNCGSYSTCQSSYTQPYQAEFVTDVTYPDGSFVNPGQTFVKTWRLRNVGTSVWGSGTALVFISGSQMASQNLIPLPYTVAPGQTVDISVDMRAPAANQNASSQWMLQAPNGTRFGVGCYSNTSIWVNVTTAYNGGYYPGNCYCSGTPGCYCSGNNVISNTGSRAGKNPYCNNKLREVKDVTIPDYTVMTPGSAFRKTWRMKNGGTCEWDANYMLVKAGGDDLGGSEYVRINSANIIYGTQYTGKRAAGKVYPGDILEISIDLQAPTTPGTYQTYYKLRDNMGYEFGYGSYAAEPFWVKIVVTDSVAVDGKTVNTDAVKPLQVVNVNAVQNENSCGEQSIDQKALSNGKYQLTWKIENNGSKDWTEDYRLVLMDKNPRISLENDQIIVPATAVGDFAEITFIVTVDQNASDDGTPNWLEFSITDGTDPFENFYFELVSENKA